MDCPACKTALDIPGKTHGVTNSHPPTIFPGLLCPMCAHTWVIQHGKIAHPKGWPYASPAILGGAKPAPRAPSIDEATPYATLQSHAKSRGIPANVSKPALLNALLNHPDWSDSA